LLERVLILGSTGLIGHQIYNYLRDFSNYELLNIDYRKKLMKDTILLDARNENDFIEKIKDLKPQYIINCIGLLISASNKDIKSAIFLNAYMPHRLKALADEIDAKLIHISTDCVFSGYKKEPYTENDFKDGKDIYAKTKGLGEIICEKHLTLRTSVVGPELKSDGEELFHWFMNQEDKINGFTKSIWSGVTTFELAKAVKYSIEENITGLYHVTNNTSINKYELLKLFKKYTNKPIDIKKVDGNDIDKSFIDTRQLIKYEIPSYEKMISNMIRIVSENKKLYSQYDV
jgi:dTDP-4-dehydrorhamnose reductase